MNRLSFSISFSEKEDAFWIQAKQFSNPFNSQLVVLKFYLSFTILENVFITYVCIHRATSEKKDSGSNSESCTCMQLISLIVGVVLWHFYWADCIMHAQHMHDCNTISLICILSGDKMFYTNLHYWDWRFATEKVKIIILQIVLNYCWNMQLGS